MSSQFQKDFAQLLKGLDKANRVQRYLELKEALAQADGKLKELTSTVLEQNDHRFRIVEADTSERAPNAKQYIALHGQEAWEENKNIVPVKRHVRGIR